MMRPGEILIEEARRQRAERVMLSGYLGCTVRPYPAHPGRVEALGLPGVTSLIGTPDDVRAEGRRVLLREWYPFLGTLGESHDHHDEG